MLAGIMRQSSTAVRRSARLRHGKTLRYLLLVANL